MANELKIIVKFDTGKASAETKQYAEGSVGYLEQQLKKLRLAYKELDIGTEEQRQALVKLKQIEAEVNDVRGRGITVTKNSNSASANATVTLQALNYTVRDSPYFFRDFSLGLLAVGNNLNPLIDGFIRMKGELKEGQSLWGALTSSMSKAQWTILGFSFAVSMIQAITFALAKTDKQAKETTHEGLESLRKKLLEIKATIQDVAQLATTPPKLAELQATTSSRVALENLIKMGNFSTQYGDNEKALQRLEERVKRLKEREQELLKEVSAGDPTLNKYQDRIISIYNATQTLSGTALEDWLKKNKVMQTELNNTVQSLNEARDYLIAGTTALDQNKEATKRLTDARENLFGTKDKKDKGYSFITDNELEKQIRYYEGLYAIAKTENERARILEKIVKLTKELYNLSANKTSWANISDTISGMYPTDPYKNVFENDTSKYQIEDIVNKQANDLAQKNFGDTVKEFMRLNDEFYSDNQENLKAIDSIANVAGNSISNAFNNGGNAISMATQALKQFIVQLLVVQSFKYLLMSIFSPSSLPSTIGGFLGFSKNVSTIPQTTTQLPSLSSIMSNVKTFGPNNNAPIEVRVSGELVGSGSNLKAVINKRETILKKYYGN